MDDVNFVDGDIVDVTEKGLKKKVEMIPTSLASMEKVISCDAVKISDTGAYSAQDFNWTFQD